MNQRLNVLVCLRQWGQPVSPAQLARWMNRPRQYVGNALTALYSRDLCDRIPNPDHPKLYLYMAKQVQA